MSIETSFDNKSNAILDPEKMIKKLDNPPEIAIATFSQKTIELLLKNYKTEIIAYFHAGEPIPIYQINYKNKKIAIYRTIIGAASTVGALEELQAMGIKKFLYYGSCGVLSKDIEAHNIIIPTEAYRDEGVSYHYMEKSDYITVDTYKKLEKILQELNVSYTEGRTWTTDAFYRETKNNMLKRKKEGCICVEMECAGIMAVAQFRKVEAYQFFYASDNLDAEEWERRILSGTSIDKRWSLLNLALEIARKIIDE